MGRESLVFPSTGDSHWIRSNCLGKGSFGTVSIGISKTDGAIFAVKSVDRNSCFPAQLEALENEIRILRSLSSPYVVKYYGDDMTAEGSAVYRNLHMEYVDGGAAADLAKSGGVDEEGVRQCTWCVVSALRYLHSCGIIHCDVKGRNVLLGSTPTMAKLADFGSAREMDRAKTNKILPRGSPLWMAPEVVRGESQGFESDIWSLGCTVIEMVTGKPAWADEGADTLRRIGFSDELPQFPTRLSALGRDFLEKCLRRQPSQRWNCDQLLQHPFLRSASANRITDSSPRSVLNWSNLDTSEAEENSNSGEWEISAAERIGKLATTSAENWDGDGWVAVRSFGREGHGDSYACRGSGDSEEIGTGSEYLNSLRTEEEMRNSFADDVGGACGSRRGGWEAASSPRHHGNSAPNSTTEKGGFYVEDGVEFSLILLLSLLLRSSNLWHKYNNNNNSTISYFVVQILILLYPKI